MPLQRPALNTDRLVDRAAQAFGLRILAAWGIGRLVRMVALLVWIGFLANTILILRPDLLYPATFGSDTSNYVAFGERLVQGNDLYALSPGDRPAPADNPPLWSVPILSPPQMAVPWAVLTALPEVIRFYGPWSLGIAGTVALGFLFILRAPSLAVVLGLPFFAGLALTAWSGNVNAIIGPAGLLVWWAGSRPIARRWVVVAGALVALLFVIKVGPAMLWLWLVRRRGSGAIAGGGLVAFGVTAAVLLTAGWAPFSDYLSTTLAHAEDPTPQSIPGFLIGFGISPEMASIGWFAGLAALAAIVAFSGRLRVGFVAAVVGMVFLTPIVRQETISLLLIVGAPWIVRDGGTLVRTSAARIPVALAAGVAALSVCASLLTGGLEKSSMTVENTTGSQVTVRFGAPWQKASWGYAIGPGQAGLAWAMDVGTIREPLRVFRSDCSLIGELATNGLESVRIDDRAVAAGPVSPAVDPLPYSAHCASAMPDFGVPVD